MPSQDGIGSPSTMNSWVLKPANEPASDRISDRDKCSLLERGLSPTFQNEPLHLCPSDTDA